MRNNNYYKKQYIPIQNNFSCSSYSAGDSFNEEGTFKSTRYQNEEGFIIGTFTTKNGEDIVCKGNVPGYVLGLPYKISGTVINDKTWGLQVSIQNAVSIQPSSPSEIVAFLGSGAIPGIGLMTAKRIYKKFKGNTLSILQDNPERLIEISGIGDKNLQKMIKIIPEVIQDQETIGFFAQYGITNRTIARLIKEYGENTKSIVSKNPYILCKVSGFAFSRADSIAMKMGIDKYNTNRLYAGVLATLRYACQQSGHTLLPREDLINEAYNKLKIEQREPIEDAIAKLISHNHLIEDHYGIHLTHLKKAEDNIIKALNAAKKNYNLIEDKEIESFIEDAKKQMNISLTPEQKAAVTNAFTKKLSILTGKAGTGKTSACEMIVKIAEAAMIPVCLVSPTGRAAKNLSETCGIPGYTIHRALSILVPSEDKGFLTENKLSQSNKLFSDARQAFEKSELVLADEASMMDTEMAALLLKGCSKKNLVLIGDPNQLPSVGPGRVLGDIIDSKNGNLVILSKIFRQAEESPIIKAANKVESGINPCNTNGVKFYECTNEEVPDVIKKYVLPIINEEKLGYENFMFMSPIKKVPYSGVNALNDFLRPHLNLKYKKPDDPKKEFILQEGDFISQKKNNYDVGIFNGDIGVVTSVSKDGNVAVAFSDAEEIIEFAKQEVQENLMLAYASTVHRQQGSQAHTVVIVCTMNQFALLNKNLLYTAITRTKERLILIGESKAFAMAAKNTKENKRMTGLQHI